ncbi:MAG TPA: hypothetical protein VH327_05765 [Gammaproteobacteria bacterium]|nr:hypothetical protein [Gammaproteobacteria bacterium]
MDIPLLTEVVGEAASPSAVPPAPAMPATTSPAVLTIPQDLLSEVLTERIAALTDRLLRDASAEIHATLVNKVWEKLREEIPSIVEEALRENGKE